MKKKLKNYFSMRIFSSDKYLRDVLLSSPLYSPIHVCILWQICGYWRAHVRCMMSPLKTLAKSSLRLIRPIPNSRALRTYMSSSGPKLGFCLPINVPLIPDKNCMKIWNASFYGCRVCKHSCDWTLKKPLNSAPMPGARSGTLCPTDASTSPESNFHIQFRLLPFST